MTLTEIGDIYGTDKAKDHPLGHRYTDHYSPYLEPVRDKVTRVLEIGVWHGQSLKMWRTYFPNATVVGFDIDLSRFGDDLDRIELVQGDQSDPVALMQLRERGPFDLIVEDGDHVPAHQLLAFEVLFPAVKPGGIYVCEDMQTQFFNGNPTRKVYDRFMELALHIQAGGTSSLSAYFPDDVWARLDAWQKMIEFVHFYRYMAVIGRSRRV